jgi:hypothetical protein
VTDTFPLSIIQPGDVLLYSGTGFNAWVIKVKSWSAVSHCELALSQTQTAASRDGIGVGTYELRRDDLIHVLRPDTPLDMTGVKAFHAACLGQQYDWWGLLRFYTLGQQSMDKQFCSEYVTRLLRHGRLEPFQDAYDADLVSPGMFLCSARLIRIWSRA